MKFTIAYAMVLAIFGLSAIAEDNREVPSSPAATSGLATPASTAATAAPLTASLTSAITLTPAVSAMPAAPAPANTVVPSNALVPMNAAMPANAFVVLKKQPEQHRFLDAKNSFGLTAIAASLTADALSTQKGLAYPGFHEMNPIARPFVQTRTGAAAYSAGSFALLGSAMYMAHKTQHHKLEHIFPFAVAGWEGLLSARNYHVIATRPR